MALLAFELPKLSLDPSASSSSSAADAVPPPSAPRAADDKKKKKSATSSSSRAKSTVEEPSLPPMPSHISSLLDPSHRLATATELNAAILTAQGHPSTPKLPGLMGMMNWGEGLLNEKNVDWPKWDLREVLAAGADRNEEHGEEAMVL